MKKTDMLKAGLELLATTGVMTIVGGAIALVKPAKLGVIRKVAVSFAGMAISGIAVDKVTDYVDKQFNSVVDAFKVIKDRNTPKEETVEEVEAEAKA